MKICPKCRQTYFDNFQKCNSCGLFLQTVANSRILTQKSQPKIAQQVAASSVAQGQIEFRRQCRACKTVWHSLLAREKQISSSEKANCCGVISFCGNPSAQTQAVHNLEANRSEMARLRSCPKCGSANYDEGIISY